jgi:hypothetical protein
MNAELIARACRDKRLNHGSVRLLTIILTGEPAANNRWHDYAQQMGVVSASSFRKQLIDRGYLPPINKGGFHSQKKHSQHHDCKVEDTQVPVCEGP